MGFKELHDQDEYYFIKHKLDLLKKVENELYDRVKAFVAKKDILLDIRWDLFIESGLGDHDTSYHEPDGLDWNHVTLYDNFYADKYVTVHVDNMLEIALEKELFIDGDEGEIKFKEYFLEAFIKSFTHDW